MNFDLFFSAGCQRVWCHCAQVWSHPSADYGCGQFPSLYQQLLMINDESDCFASFACLEKWLWKTLGRSTKWNWINVHFLWWWWLLIDYNDDVGDYLWTLHICGFNQRWKPFVFQDEKNQLLTTNLWLNLVSFWGRLQALSNSRF